MAWTWTVLTDAARGTAQLRTGENDEIERATDETEDQPQGIDVADELLLNHGKRISDGVHRSWCHSIRAVSESTKL